MTFALCLVYKQYLVYKYLGMVKVSRDVCKGYTTHAHSMCFKED